MSTMSTADPLVEQMFSWIDQREHCAEQLKKLAPELESISRDCVSSSMSVARAGAMIGSGGSAALLFGIAVGGWSGAGLTASVATKIIEDFLSSDTMKEAQRIEEKSNRITEEIQKLFEKLNAEVMEVSSLTDPDEVERRVVTEILRAVARRSGVNLQINYHMFYDVQLFFQQRNMGPNLPGLLGILGFFALKVNGIGTQLLFAEGLKQLIRELSSAGVKTALKGGAMVVGGAVGLAFALSEAIDNWKDLIKKNRVTEASQSLRDTADEILQTCSTLRGQFDDMKKMLVDMEIRQREREREERERLQREHERKERERLQRERERQERERRLKRERERRKNPAQEKSGNQSTEQKGSEQEKENQQNKQTGSDQQGGGDQADEERDDEDEERVDEDEERDGEEEERDDEEEESESEEEESEDEESESESESESEDEESDSEEETEDDEGQQTGKKKRRKYNQKKETQSKQRGRKESEDVVTLVGGIGQVQKKTSNINKEGNPESDNNQRPPGSIKVGLLNVWSMKKNATKIKEIITENNLDVFATTETWLKKNKADILREASPENFSSCHRSRRLRRGGGVAIQYSNGLRSEQIRFNANITTFEHTAVALQHEEWNQPILFINVYYPPRYNMTTFREFLNEFEELLKEVSKRFNSIVVTGDFNIHINKDRRCYTDEFDFLLPIYNLDQHVHVPTHEDGNTLDRVITRGVQISDLSVQEVNRGNEKSFDHYLITFTARPEDEGRGKRKQEQEQRKKRKEE